MKKLVAYLLWASLTLLVILAWASWSIVTIIICRFIPDWTITSSGVWGDSYGPLNALFSSLAFIGIVTTIYLQIKQSRSQSISDERAQFERDFISLQQMMIDSKSKVTFRKIGYKKSQIFHDQDAITHTYNKIESYITSSKTFQPNNHDSVDSIHDDICELIRSYTDGTIFQFINTMSVIISWIYIYGQKQPTEVDKYVLFLICLLSKEDISLLCIYNINEKGSFKREISALKLPGFSRSGALYDYIGLFYDKDSFR